MTYNVPWREFDIKKWQEANNRFDHETWNKLTAVEGEKHFHANGLVSVDGGYFEAILEAMDKAKRACGGRPPFKPNAYYNSHGDILHVSLSNETYYAKWLNPQVSVLLSSETDEVVGFEIWFLSKVKGLQEIVKLWNKTETLEVSKEE